MAETTTVSFDLRETAIALLKEQNIHEGKWLVSFEFTLGAGIMGANIPDSRPSAFVQVQRLQLTRAEANSPQFPFLVDAAEVNPKAG